MHRESRHVVGLRAFLWGLDWNYVATQLNPQEHVQAKAVPVRRVRDQERVPAIVFKAKLNLLS